MDKFKRRKKPKLHALHLAASGVISLTVQAGQKRKRSSWSRDGGSGSDGDEPNEEEIDGFRDDLGNFSADDIQAILKVMKYKIGGILFGVRLLTTSGNVILTVYHLASTHCCSIKCHSRFAKSTLEVRSRRKQGD
ncbi:hypothetical protein M405DRAFT_361941 [Rhizopogon salebrosus TDB-379]|nr:hypothetical protein M405DRAFT_361941 [Rhizopogon salebrosus TDB-379]